MIGTVLGTTMIVAGVILSGWGHWRLRRPLVFFRHMYQAWLDEEDRRRYAECRGIYLP